MDGAIESAKNSNTAKGIVDAEESSTYDDILCNYGDYLFGAETQTARVHHHPGGGQGVQHHKQSMCSASFTNMVQNSQQDLWFAVPDLSVHEEQGSCNVNYSQGENMSYTQMLLGVEMSAETGYYSSLLQGPMVDENKMYMITGRYSDGNHEYFEQEEEQNNQQDNSTVHNDIPMHEEDNTSWQFDIGGDNMTVNRDDTTMNTNDTTVNRDGQMDAQDGISWQFDKSAEQNADNMTEEAGMSDEDQNIANNRENYDIFGDNPSNAFNENNNVEEQDSSVEHLSQEDILIFIENESVAAAQSSSQEVRSHHVPHVNMVFDSDVAAYSFYNEYAQICGFAIKKAGNYHGKRNANAAHTRATFLCNRSGKVVDAETLEQRKKKKQESRQQRTGVVPVLNSKRARRNTIEITGCKAKMVVSLMNDKWAVISLDLEHNHELSPPDESKYLRSHKHMTEDEKLFIRTFNSVKLPPRKIMAILSYLRGGVGAVPYTKKHVNNERTSIRKECSQNDMTQVLDYFRKRKEEDPRFYYRFKIGEGNKVLSIFWADGNSRRLYEMFGDCVSFDTTYKTNRYNLPFAPFVGVTGHGNNCLFACAIMQNETVDCFKWLFETFLDCIENKAPITIITDQCVSMKLAIPSVFPNTVHRNCFFHIRKKAEEKCGRTFATKKDLHADFSDILRNSLTVEEFEMLWQQMVQQYDVGHVKYFRAMWDYMQRFVPVYFKRNFFPFIHSTARSEGTNSVFKDNVGSTYNVISFLAEYQRISQDIEEKEREQDSITRTTIPSYWLRSEIEVQAGRIYNRQIFYKFQKQLMFTANLHVDEIVKNERYEVYKTRYLAEKDFRTRRYLVLVNLEQKEFSCICCKFQKDGIVCSHILRVLVNLNISELPDKYFIDRWKPKERKTIKDKKFNVPQQLTEKNRHLRFNLLSNRLIDIASEGSKSNERYLMVVKESIKIEEKLDAMTLAEDLEEVQRKQGPNATKSQPVAVDDGYGETLQNPDIAKSRGRPTVVGRHKTIAEQFRTKQKITCSHCGSHEHNYATCEFKHLDKSTFEKKTKKKTGTNSAKRKQNSGAHEGHEGNGANKKPKGQHSPMEL